MKKNIHLTYYADAKIVCACGNTFTTGSTLKEIHVEICSHCHPFFTGKQTIIDTAGRVDRFKTRIKKKEEIIKKALTVKKVKTEKEVEATEKTKDKKRTATAKKVEKK